MYLGLHFAVVCRYPQELVSRREEEPVSSSLPFPDHSPVFRVEKFGFVAEIMASHSRGSEIFHYVIQRKNSSGIVHWGQELSLQRAQESVEEFLEQYGSDFKRAL